MNSSSDQTIRALARTVQDVNRPDSERWDALRHLAAIWGENADTVATIPVEDIGAVVAGMTVWSRIGLRDLTLTDAAEAIADGRKRRIRYGR